MKTLKNYLLMPLALFILISYALFSRPINLEEAKEIAMQHNLQLNKYSIELQNPSDYKLIASSHDIFSTTTENPTFYIYNLPQKGWVIVAGDDIARPVLAYSKEASYSLENLPDNAKYWLEQYDIAISKAIKQGAPQSEKIANEWLIARAPKKRTSLLAEVVPPLIKTKWGQDSPYNDLCPYDEKEKKRTPTGYIATAMAQIMKYWNFPANGRGKNIYTHKKYGKLYADFENTIYDWDNITDEYDQNSTEKQKKAIATLIYHCGIAVSMNYRVKSSTTKESYIASALKMYFMYDTTAKMITRSDYHYNTWLDMLKKNLDNSQPILYSGETYGIRYSFVCDGYDTDNRFHFNLCWDGGIHNGYYYVDNITGYYHNVMQTAIADIKPIEKFRPQITLLKPLELKQAIVYQNSTVKISANIINKKAESFSGSLSLRLFDAEDNFLMPIAEQEIDNLEPNKPTEITFETNPLFNTSAGKYYVKLYDKHRIVKQWLLSSGDNKLEIEVQKDLNSENKLSLYSSPTLAEYQFDKYQIEKETELKATASFINTSKENFRGVISASIYDDKGTIIKELASYNVTEAIAPNDYIKDIEFSNTISDLDLDLDYGVYFIGFRSKEESGEFTLINPNNFISFIKFEIVQLPLITDLRLKDWINSNRDKFRKVIINEDGGITCTKTNLGSLARIRYLDCADSKLITINELIRYMPNLQVLECNNNSLIELDISKNTKLDRLNCHTNQLTSLDVSKNPELKYLTCLWNQLTQLDISNNIKLEELKCWDNQITSLDASKNTKLKLLSCHNNQLASLDVSKNAELTYLQCNNNQINNLDVSKSVNLTYLQCADNQLTNLDMSNNLELEELHCNNNQINNLDVTKNIGLRVLLCHNNQINNLDVTKNIYLGKLTCYDNNLTSLDVTKNIELTSLYCNNNQLTDLDVTKNTKLVYLHCHNNQINNLDVINHINLEDLHCSNNQLTNLDVTKNIELRYLHCNDNMLNNLSIRPLLRLWNFNCCNQAEGFILYLNNEQKNMFTEENYCNAILHTAYPNELITNPRLKNWIKANTNKLPEVIINEDGGIDSTTANLEALAKIETLDCSRYRLGTIDELIRHMTNLKILICSNTFLTELNVSKNTKLEELYCVNDSLTSLDVTSNIKLKSLYCNHNRLTSLDVSTNVELTLLDCSLNRLSNLDISKSIKLEKIACDNNLLTSLDVSKNIELTLLYCYNNIITSLDLTNNVKLTELICSQNELNKLDLSNNIELTYLKCNYNRVSKLDMSKNIKLTFLDCSINEISNLEISKNINLEKLDCSSNPISNLDISKNIKLKLLSCAINGLTNLDVSKNIELRDLYCSYNQLSELDISPLLNLVSLRCCNQAEDFTLFLTSEQKNKFDKGAYCNAILKEKDGSICEIEWLDIYPNPTSDRFFINSNSFADEIKILNLAGEVLYSKTLNAEKTEIDISNLPAGVYLVITKGKVGKVVKN